MYYNQQAGSSMPVLPPANSGLSSQIASRPDRPLLQQIDTPPSEFVLPLRPAPHDGAGQGHGHGHGHGLETGRWMGSNEPAVQGHHHIPRSEFHGMHNVHSLQPRQVSQRPSHHGAQFPGFAAPGHQQASVPTQRRRRGDHFPTQQRILQPPPGFQPSSTQQAHIESGMYQQFMHQQRRISDSSSHYNPPNYNPPSYNPPSYNPLSYNHPSYDPPSYNPPGPNIPRIQSGPPPLQPGGPLPPPNPIHIQGPQYQGPQYGQPQNQEAAPSQPLFHKNLLRLHNMRPPTPGPTPPPDSRPNTWTTFGPGPGPGPEPVREPLPYEMSISQPSQGRHLIFHDRQLPPVHLEFPAPPNSTRQIQHGSFRQAFDPRTGS